MTFNKLFSSRSKRSALIRLNKYEISVLSYICCCIRSQLERCQVYCSLNLLTIFFRIPLHPIYQGHRSFSELRDSVKAIKNRWTVVYGLLGPHPEPLDNYLDVCFSLKLVLCYT